MVFERLGAGGAAGLGAGLGVLTPIGIEFVAKGKRFKALAKQKWAGVIGSGIGIVGLTALGVNEAMHNPHKTSEEDKAFIGAAGVGLAATGLAILALDRAKRMRFQKLPEAEISLGDLQGEDFDTDLAGTGAYDEFQDFVPEEQFGGGVIEI